MGASFKLEHANIMAYITSRSSGPPRVLRHDLQEYLQMLAERPTDYLILEQGFGSGPWPESISEIAGRARNRLADTRTAPGSETVAPPEVERILAELRSEFSGFPLYALAVGEDRTLSEEAHRLAEMGMLVLIPIYREGVRNFEVLDPIPVFSRALHSIQDWPGFLFWTTNGVSAFVPLEQARALATELLVSTYRVGSARLERRRWINFGALASWDDVLRRHDAVKSRQRRLLHISDLHFGTRHALENQALLDAELREVVSAVDRVVITGDLFDSPKPEYATMFANFKHGLTHLARGREPVVIPGNHDQRMFGNLGRDFEQIAGVGSKKVVVDDDSKMIFACFNSSERGSFARGKIPKSQFRSIGGEYRTLTAARPELKRYLSIALVHHHPFSFDVHPETWAQRALSAFGLREETFLAMVNADDLHQWCADWDIRTILHGHKHKARYLEREVSGSDCTKVKLTAIGCGSSLGAEGSPVSYNLLEWEPNIQRWVASIFESTNGGAFRERLAAVSPSGRPTEADHG